jgi:hypothetical protein
LRHVRSKQRWNPFENRHLVQASLCSHQQVGTVGPLPIARTTNDHMSIMYTCLHRHTMYGATDSVTL